MSANLEDLLSDALEAPTAPVLKRGLNYSHKALADLIIAQPGISQNSLAAAFGYSASWISTVMSSDAFQAYLAERTDELVDPTLKLAVKERFEGMMRRSLEILNEKLSRPANDVSDQLALRAFELSSRAAGYGARTDLSPPAAAVELHVHLERLAENLPALLRQKKSELIDQPVSTTHANQTDP